MTNSRTRHAPNDFVSSYGGNLTQHMKSKHWNIQNIKCDKCEFKTSIGSSLTKHIDRVHWKRYQCGSCHYKTLDIVDIKEHVKLHLGNQSLNCDHCDYQTSTGKRLALHKKAKHCRDVQVKLVRLEMKYQTIESMSKPSVNSKSIHIKEETLQNRRSEKYPCQYRLCEYGANTEENLTNHLMACHVRDFKLISDKLAIKKEEMEG